MAARAGAASSRRGRGGCSRRRCSRAACSSASVPPPVSAPATKVDTTMSDPAEYQVSHISEEAGENIFSRIGVGDPYRTGLPYPFFLALLSDVPRRARRRLRARSPIASGSRRERPTRRAAIATRATGCPSGCT